ncbi:MAG: hypothetical protein JXR36_01755 [Bacteroidales bacterium]|nr:hypothetical protein [Bacteroidales bacterium]
MKKIFPIIIVLISLFALTTNAQSVVSQELSVDTSKLDNFSYYFNEQQKIRKEQSGYFASDEEVKSWYYDSDHMTRENGSIKLYRDFNKYKQVSYPVKNKEIFNTVLPDAEMLFEYVYGEMELYSQRLLAKYNGKYYGLGQFNHLLETFGINEQITVEEKIECVINWAYWLYDQNIEILKIEQTSERMPYDTIINHRVSLDSEEKIAVNVHFDYQAEYYGRIILEGNEMEFYATIVGDKKFIKSINLFNPGTKDSIFPHNQELKYNISLKTNNPNYQNDKSMYRYDYLNIEINGSSNLVETKVQDKADAINVNDYCRVVYYPASSSNIVLNIPINYVQSLYNVDILIKSIGSTESHSIYFENLPVLYQTGVHANITNLPSGFYEVLYRAHSDNNGNPFNYLEDSYIIPESYSYQTLTATGQTVKYYYINQMFNYDYSAANSYINHLHSRMNEVCTKYINDGLITQDQFFDDNDVIDISITNRAFYLSQFCNK